MDNNYLESVADEYGDIDNQIKVLEARKKVLREDLMTFVKDIPVVGLRWTVSKSESSQASLDTKAVREFLGDKAGQFERVNKVAKILVKQTRVLGQTAEGA
jgi:hypothetical protein